MIVVGSQSVHSNEEEEAGARAMLGLICLVKWFCLYPGRSEK